MTVRAAGPSCLSTRPPHRRGRPLGPRAGTQALHSQGHTEACGRQAAAPPPGRPATRGTAVSWPIPEFQASGNEAAAAAAWGLGRPPAAQDPAPWPGPSGPRLAPPARGRRAKAAETLAGEETIPWPALWKPLSSLTSRGSLLLGGPACFWDQGPGWGWRQKCIRLAHVYPAPRGGLAWARPRILPLPSVLGRRDRRTLPLPLPVRGLRPRAGQRREWQTRRCYTLRKRRAGSPGRAGVTRLLRSRGGGSQGSGDVSRGCSQGPSVAAWRAGGGDGGGGPSGSPPCDPAGWRSRRVPTGSEDGAGAVPRSAELGFHPWTGRGRRRSGGRGGRPLPLPAQAEHGPRVWSPGQGVVSQGGVQESQRPSTVTGNGPTLEAHAEVAQTSSRTPLCPGTVQGRDLGLLALSRGCEPARGWGTASVTRSLRQAGLCLHPQEPRPLRGDGPERDAEVPRRSEKRRVEGPSPTRPRGGCTPIPGKRRGPPSVRGFVSVSVRLPV